MPADGGSFPGEHTEKTNDQSSEQPEATSVIRDEGSRKKINALVLNNASLAGGRERERQEYLFESLREPISNLRNVIAQRNDVSPERVRLIFRGQVLDSNNDSNSLESANLENESTIHAIIRAAESLPSMTDALNANATNTGSGMVNESLTRGRSYSDTNLSSAASNQGRPQPRTGTAGSNARAFPIPSRITQTTTTLPPGSAGRAGLDDFLSQMIGAAAAQGGGMLQISMGPDGTMRSTRNVATFGTPPIPPAAPSPRSVGTSTARSSPTRAQAADRELPEGLRRQVQAVNCQHQLSYEEVVPVHPVTGQVSWWCNRCLRNFHEPRAFQCRQCDYHLCDNCYRLRTEEQARSASVPASPAPMRTAGTQSPPTVLPNPIQGATTTQRALTDAEMGAFGEIFFGPQNPAMLRNMARAAGMHPLSAQVPTHPPAAQEPPPASEGLLVRRRVSIGLLNLATMPLKFRPNISMDSMRKKKSKLQTKLAWLVPGWRNSVYGIVAKWDDESIDSYIVSGELTSFAKLLSLCHKLDGDVITQQQRYSGSNGVSREVSEFARLLSILQPYLVDFAHIYPSLLATNAPVPAYPTGFEHTMASMLRNVARLSNMFADAISLSTSDALLDPDTELSAQLRQMFGPQAHSSQGSGSQSDVARRRSVPASNRRTSIRSGTTVPVGQFIFDFNVPLN